MSLKADDKLQAVIERCYATPEVHAKAHAVLCDLDRRGKLPPVPDGSGDPLADYIEILGVRI